MTTTAKTTGADRRSRRHAQTKDEILAAAWALSREQGLAGWTLAELARGVGMRAPSLYQYFASKHAVYDAMFAQGNRDLLQALTSWRAQARAAGLDPEQTFRSYMRQFVAFDIVDPVRHTLLFQRSVPGFIPSADSFGLAVEVLDELRRALRDLGIDDPAAVDLWTAIAGGLTSQQVTNDPLGDAETGRWARLLDDAIDMFLNHVRRERNQ